MPLDIEALLAEAELPETSVTICLKGSLASRFEALDAQLSGQSGAPTSLAGGPELQIAAELDALRQEMLAHERIFLFRAMPSLAFAALRAVTPSKKDGQSDEEFADAYHQWVCRVVAGSCYDPVMTVDQVHRLAEKLSDGQWRKLSNAAWSLNFNDSTIPFSAAGSALIRTSAARSPQPDPPASPGAGSLAGPSAPSPSTSTPTDG